MILLLFGLISIVASNASRYYEGEPIIVKDAGRGNPEAWEVSASFKKGDYIIADYRVHWTWTEPPYEIIGYGDLEVPIKIVGLDIISPEGNRTSFMHVLAVDPEKAHASFAKTVLSSGGGLIVNNVSDVAGVPADFINETFGGQPVEELGGIAQYDGTYKLVIQPPFPPPTPIEGEEVGPPEPPSWLALCKKPLERPLAFLLPVGAPVAILGFALVVLGNKSKKV